MRVHRFNVFGRPMHVVRADDAWVLYAESSTGIPARVYDVIIPSDIPAEQLAQYLDDIYHEYATSQFANVFPLD